MKIIQYIEQVSFGGGQQASFSDPEDAVTQTAFDRIEVTGKRGNNTVLRATLWNRTFDGNGDAVMEAIGQYPQGSAEVLEPVAPPPPPEVPVQ